MLKCALIALSLTGSAWAHHDVSATIAELTKKIEAGATADLYFKRAVEFRALRKPAKVEVDLRAALKLTPDHLQSITALAELLLVTGKKQEAEQLASRASDFAKTPSEKTGAYFLFARVARARGHFNEALATCDVIQTEFPEHDDSIDLFHADLLMSQNLPDEAADLLKESWKRTKGVVLRNAWIDVALTAGHFQEAAPIIAKELKESRFRAAWLIRKSRIPEVRKDEDLHEALRELNKRIKPERPDLTLIADRGVAYALLGEKEKAAADLGQLKKSSLPSLSYRLLESMLKK